MKKLFSFILMFLTVATLQAAKIETTLWEGTYVDGVEINGTTVATFSAGDVLRVYVTVPENGANFKIVYKGNDNGWAETAIPSINNQWPWINGGETYYDVTFTAADITALSGMNIYIYKGENSSITKVSLMTEGSTTVFDKNGVADLSKFVSDGSAGYTYDDGKGTITATDAWTGVYLALLEGQYVSGQQLTVKFAESTKAQIHVCYVGKEWGDGTQITETGTAISLPLTETEKISRIDIQLVEANTTAVITEVSVGDIPAVTYPILLWEGSQEINWGANPGTWQTISKDKFASVKAGDILRVVYQNVKAGAQMGLQYSVPDNWAMLPGLELTTVDGLAKRITLTQEMIDAILSGDLHITGAVFTLTKVEVLDPATVKTLTCSVPVTGEDWVWNSSETPSFTVNIQNDNDEVVTATATLLLTTDKMVAVKTLEDSKEVAANSSDALTFTLSDVTLTPGFYRATMIVNDETVRSFNFGYAPTEISSPADKQSDFDSFWNTAKEELAAIEATDEPVLTEITSKSTDKRKVYLVEFKSVSDGDGQPVTVRGYYAEPTDGKKHPVIMHYQGYDSGYRPGGQGVEPWCLSGDGDDLSADYAEFILSTRGQSVNNRPASERADGIERDFTNTYGDWFAYNFGNKDKYYYRGAYMDVIRAIDFMATRRTSDMTNLYAEGQSQGGAFTYAAAALSGREFKAIAPGIAFMGDFPDYFELANWPASVARENQGTMTDAEMYAFLSYFDTKNLATLISDKTAVIATIGVQDDVCPPHTNIVPYNNLAEGTTKEISFNPENGHQVADNWYTVYMNYFASKYVEPVANTFDEDGVADLERVEVQDAEKVVYNADTHTVTTTEGWTGVQLTVVDGEEVSGKELRVTFDREMAVKCYVKYTDETDADVIMSDAAEILYFTLDETKKLYQIQIQPTEAATFAFQEIKVNAESTKPVVTALEDGESRTLFEDATGVVMSWNEICQMDEEWGAILETGEQLYVTVTARTEGSEWPKIILRDATSVEVTAVELSDVTNFPYMVKMVLTDEMTTKLKDGFRFSGDGVTITKIELYKPAPAQEGDIHTGSMNFFRDGSYNAETCTMTTTARWGEAGWQPGDDRYSDKTLIIVNFESVDFPVTLKMEYVNTSDTRLAVSAGVAAGKTEVQLALPMDVKIIDKVYLTYSEPASLCLTDASVIAAANARPLTGEAIVSGIQAAKGGESTTEDRYNLMGQKVRSVKGIIVKKGKKYLVR